MSLQSEISDLKDRLGWSDECGAESPALTSLLIGCHENKGLFDILSMMATEIRLLKQTNSQLVEKIKDLEFMCQKQNLPISLDGPNSMIE